jgi:outer membrane lipoprotein LolB
MNDALLLLPLACAWPAAPSARPARPAARRPAPSASTWRPTATGGRRAASNIATSRRQEGIAERQIHWQQTGQHRRHLISPTGQTVASSTSRRAATLKESGKRRCRADLDTLSANAGLDLAGVGPARLAARLCHRRDGKRFVASPANDNVITARWLEA